MSKAPGHKIVLQMTPSGLKVMKLSESEVARAIEQLRSGEQPQGAELDDVPEHARLVAYCLRRLGKGWMLLDNDGEVNGEITAKTKTDISVPNIEQALEEILDGARTNEYAAFIKNQPHYALQQRMRDLLEDRRELDKLFVEVRHGVGHRLGEFLGRELIARMGLYQEGFCWRCWGVSSCTCFGKSEQKNGTLSEAEEKPKSEKGDKTSTSTKPEKSESKTAVRSQKTSIGTVIDGAGHRTPELSIVLPVELKVEQSLALKRKIRQLRNDYYLETGYRFPPIDVRSLKQTENRLSEVSLEADEFIIARRRKTVQRIKLTNSKGSEMIDEIAAEFETLLRRFDHQWLTISQLAELFKEIRGQHGGLLEEFKDAGGSNRELLPLLRQMLKAHLSIRDLATVLEVWLEYPKEERFEVLERLGTGELW